LEAFGAKHRPCGAGDAGVGTQAADGDRLVATCACGATFDCWISPELAAEDLLRSRLSVFDN
jgi:hypothetical protein